MPICLDSLQPRSLQRHFRVILGKPLINSVNGEEANLTNLLPIIKEYGAAVIGLTMDDNGIPTGSRSAPKERRPKSWSGQLNWVFLLRMWLSIRWYSTVGADQKAGRVTLDLPSSWFVGNLGVNINLGASNVSFGLPDRHTVNQAFLAIGANTRELAASSPTRKN